MIGLVLNRFGATRAVALCIQGFRHCLACWSAQIQVLWNFMHEFWFFSLIDGLEWNELMNCFQKSTPLVLVFLKAPFLSYSFSTIILMILSVMLLSILTILLYNLSVIELLICGNKYS